MVTYGLKEWSKGKHFPTEHFHLTINLYDTPRTITAAIANLPKECKRINVVYYKALAQHREFWYQVITKGIKINWLNEDLSPK